MAKFEALDAKERAAAAAARAAGKRTKDTTQQQSRIDLTGDDPRPLAKGEEKAKVSFRLSKLGRHKKQNGQLSIACVEALQEQAMLYDTHANLWNLICQRDFPDVHGMDDTLFLSPGSEHIPRTPSLAIARAAKLKCCQIHHLGYHYTWPASESGLLFWLDPLARNGKPSVRLKHQLAHKYCTLAEPRARVYMLRAWPQTSLECLIRAALAQQQFVQGASIVEIANTLPVSATQQFTEFEKCLRAGKLELPVTGMRAHDGGHIRGSFEIEHPAYRRQQARAHAKTAAKPKPRITRAGKGASLSMYPRDRAKHICNQETLSDH
jgi:hypothetical protein